MRCWGMMLAIVAVYGWSLSAWADPAGTYSVTDGSSGDGSYRGEVTAESTGEVYEVNRTISYGTFGNTFTGFGIAERDAFSVAYQSGDSVAAVIQINRSEDGWHGGSVHVCQTELGRKSWVVRSRSDGADPLVSSKDGTFVGLSERFVAAEGYTPQSVEALNEAIGQRLTPVDSGSVFLPSGTLSPFVKAVLALEAVDGMQERVRYRLSYGQVLVAAPPAASPLPVSFVQIDRFNIGPEIRKELVAIHGAENVAPPTVFGVGPHVSWRLTMRPLMGHQADVIAASRMEIATAAAGAETCFGRSCLSTAMVIEDAAPWSGMQAAGHDPDAVYPAERDGLPTPAAVVDMLTNEFGFELREGVGASEPFAVIIMELNLGQDATLDAALREGALMDDSVSAVWHRISATPSVSGAAAQFYAARAFECQRVPAFAEPGKYCP